MADTGGARESPVPPAAPAGADDWVVLDQNDPNLSPPQPTDADRAAVAVAAAAAAAAAASASASAAASPPAASEPREAPVQDAVEYDGSVGSWESEEEGAGAEAEGGGEDAATHGNGAGEGDKDKAGDGLSAAPSVPVSPPSPPSPQPQPQQPDGNGVPPPQEEEAVVVDEVVPAAPLPPRVVMLRGEPVDLRQMPAPAPVVQQQQPPPPPPPRRVKEFRFPSLGDSVAYRAKEVVKCSDAACGVHADECSVETPAVYLAAPLRADGTEVPGGKEKVVKVLAPTCAVSRAGTAVGAAAAAAASAAGGHIVAAEAVDAAGSGGGTACLMKHYKLGSLQALAGRLSASQKGGVPEEQILSVALQLLKALKAMPRGHRRICPAHVLCEIGGYSVALLPPEVLGEVPVVQDGEQELLYAAPEEVERRRSQGSGDEDGCSSKEARAADIFSVGAALFSITFLSTPAILRMRLKRQNEEKNKI